MNCRFTDLRCKEVINICDGCRLGYVGDVECQLPEGQMTALIVPGPFRFFGLFGRGEEYYIPWDCIRQVGDDIILVDKPFPQREPPRRERRYKSASITEFWRRWHISLSSWLRDYLYISLGGNRHGKFRQYLNLIITMFLGGLWHGASWNFVLWGTFHGVALAFHKAWMSIIGRKKGETSHGIRRVLGVIITFHFVCFCWIFFRNADFHNSMDMLNQIFTAFRPQLFPQLIEGYWRVFALMAVGFLLHFAPDSWENAVCRGVIKLPFLGKAIVMVAMIYLVIQMKSSEIQPFIYFQF